MLRIATVFSGIGAIEQALKRMNKPHKIIFACDNGGVDLINDKPDVITKTYLENKIRELKEEVNLLKNDDSSIDYIELIESKLENQKLKLQDISLDNVQISNLEIIDILSHLKETTKKFKNINLDLTKNFREDKIFLLYKYFSASRLRSIDDKKIKIFSDILKSSHCFKKIKREYSDINQELNQILQVLETQLHIKEISTIKKYEEKKEYVDNLYKKINKNNNVMASYLENYDIEPKNFHHNVSLLDGNQYKGKVDLFVGGSPCQSFSMAGKRKGLEDTRGTLFYEFVRLIKEIEPRFFIYENVKGMINHDKGKTWRIIQETFKGLNYSLKVEKLNAVDFKIPQRRERIFVIGCRNEEDYNKLKNIEKFKLEHNMIDFILDNNNIFMPNIEPKFTPIIVENRRLEIDNNWCSGLPLTVTQKNFVANAEKLKRRYTQINGEIMLTQRAHQQYNLHGDFIEYDFNKLIISDKVKKYILDVDSVYNKKDLESQLNTEIAKTIVATCHKMHRVSVDNYLCYGKDEIPLNKRIIRKLHPRECLRLMGFGDDFKIVVSATEAYRQAGNSIVVDVLIAILKSMEEII